MVRFAARLGLLGLCASACSEPTPVPSNVGVVPSAKGKASPSAVASYAAASAAVTVIPSASASALASAASDVATPPRALPAASASTVTSCVGLNMRLYGSTCCEVRGSREREHPGEVFLDCSGPQIGTTCAKKADCDVVCFCKGQESLLSPGGSRAGPADGTRGQTGVCGGKLQVGVWMCEIDEDGTVTHVIVD